MTIKSKLIPFFQKQRLTSFSDHVYIGFSLNQQDADY